MRLLLVDDHAVIRSGLRRLLGNFAAAEIMEAATGREALATVRTGQPDMVLLDLGLPDLGGLELLRRLLLERPVLRILVFSMYPEAFRAAQALRAGAAGYVSKRATPEELVDAVRRVAEGGRYIEREIAQELALRAAEADSPVEQLSGRDIEILRLLSAGRSLAEIAATLGISYKTVANTCTQIKAKLGVSRTADLMRMAIEFGLT
ncbi:response regulator [Paracraurococcus lichenis]|uniref:Response regulator transcription factor n=1 Tax=Paracraurococcus lichenis TaxID=3064888 RepID=A0ABT9EBU8_9PROT|nr:response regulator transcription factor [Paracraurococcus sp. LOR1-02]MDO9713510.1 response regulator transcription factor [Paracraurococcus sp. LOR1-02]